MTPTNVVSMDFETKEAMEDFLETYDRDSPILYPDAEMLLMIKTTETSCVGVSVYPNEEARSLAESRTSGKLKYLVKENFRLSGDMVVKHVFTNKGELNDWSKIYNFYMHSINGSLAKKSTDKFSQRIGSGD